MNTRECWKCFYVCMVLINIVDHAVSVDGETKDQSFCSQGGSLQCHSNATCIDYDAGYCCVCEPGFYGNGMNCIKPDLPQRVNGNVKGTLNGVYIDSVDLNSYVVPNDGRTFTAISGIPPTIGHAMQTLYVIADVLGWLFALPVSPRAQNGFAVTGGDFNRSLIISFNSGRQNVTVKQRAWHALGYMNMDTEVEGEMPNIAAGTVNVEDFSQEFRRFSKGTLQSFSTRTYTMDGQSFLHTVDETITFKECDAKPLDNDIDYTRLSVSKAYVVYEKREEIVRFATSNRVDTRSDRELPGYVLHKRKFCPEEGTIKWIPNATLSQCVTECDSDVNCVSFVYVFGAGCWLKSVCDVNALALLNHDNRNTYYKIDDRELPGYVLHKRKFCPEEGTIKWIPNATLSQCATECDSDVNCVSFVYVFGAGCWLKSVCDVNELALLNHYNRNTYYKIEENFVPLYVWFIGGIVAAIIIIGLVVQSVLRLRKKNMKAGKPIMTIDYSAKSNEATQDEHVDIDDDYLTPVQHTAANGVETTQDEHVDIDDDYLTPVQHTAANGGETTKDQNVDIDDDYLTPVQHTAANGGETTKDRNVDIDDENLTPLTQTSMDADESMYWEIEDTQVPRLKNGTKAKDKQTYANMDIVSPENTYLKLIPEVAKDTEYANVNTGDKQQYQTLATTRDM